MSGHNYPQSKCMMSLLIDVSTRYLDKSTKVLRLCPCFGELEISPSIPWIMMPNPLFFIRGIRIKKLGVYLVNAFKNYF